MKEAVEAIQKKFMGEGLPIRDLILLVQKPMLAQLKLVKLITQAFHNQLNFELWGEAIGCWGVIPEPKESQHIRGMEHKSLLLNFLLQETCHILGECLLYFILEIAQGRHVNVVVDLNVQARSLFQSIINKKGFQIQLKQFNMVAAIHSTHNCC